MNARDANPRTAGPLTPDLAFSGRRRSPGAGRPGTWSPRGAERSPDTRLVVSPPEEE